MKTLLSIPVVLLLFCSVSFAANPAFQDFYGTNGIVIRTNGNKVQVDGSALASTNNAVVFTNLVHTNVTWVAKNGNNTTGTPGNFALPFLSISNAVQASPAGTLVVVEPGVYNESIRLKNGVNLHMPSGVIVSQSVNLPVVFIDNSGAVTSTLSGDFLIRHTGDASNTDGIKSQGADSLLTIYGGTIDIVGSSDYGIVMEDGSLVAEGTKIYSGEHGVSNEKASNNGDVSFIGTIYTTNNAAFIDGGFARSNYLRGYFSSQNYHVIQHTLGYLLVEDFDAISYSAGHDAIDYQNGDMELRRGKVTSTDDEPTIGKGGSGLLILDNVQLNTGANATYSVDDIFGSGTVQLRTPIWATKPIDPDINVTSNGFTRLSRYLSITTNDYQFPAVQGSFDSFLKNDSLGALSWSTNLSLLVVTNLNVINTTVLSNVNVKGDLIITNITMGGASLRTNQYTTNISGTPVIGSFWFGGTNGAPVTNGPRNSAIEYIPVMRTWRQGDVGAQGAGHDTIDTQSISNYWNSTNQGFGSVAFGSNNWAWGGYSTIANGMFNIISSNAFGSFIGSGSNNIIHTNAFFSFIGSGDINKIRMNSRASVIVGGTANLITDSDFAFIGGGQSGQITGISDNSTLAGGAVNEIASGSVSSTIGGGDNNDISQSDNATIAGGDDNDIISTSDFGTIGGGSLNDLSGASYGTIAGGQANQMSAARGFIGGGNANFTGSDAASISGGVQNFISTSSGLSAVLGGASNFISVAASAAVGNYLTNTAIPRIVEIGYGDSGGNNRKLRVDVNGAKVLTYGGAAAVGGTLLVTNTVVFNAGSAETNLQAVTIGANVLTNNQERILFRASGRFAATSNTKQIKVVYGSETIFDSTAGVANTGAWVLDGEIIRTGATAQSCNVNFNGGTNVVFVRTASQDAAQTNGIATVLKITGTASGDGDITNRTFTVQWAPTP